MSQEERRPLRRQIEQKVKIREQFVSSGHKPSYITIAFELHGENDRYDYNEGIYRKNHYKVAK